MAKPIWERKPENMLSTEARDWLAELQEEWNGLQEKAEKLEVIRDLCDRYYLCLEGPFDSPSSVIIAVKEILEAEGSKGFRLPPGKVLGMREIEESEG